MQYMLVVLTIIFFITNAYLSYREVHISRDAIASVVVFMVENWRIFLLRSQRLAESIMQRSGVRPSVPSAWLTRGSVQRDQRTFRSDNNENSVTL